METENKIDAFLVAHNITIESVFAPMTGKPERTKRAYNYTVTVKKDGRDVITTNYSMGTGHGDFYKKHHAKDGRLGDYDRSELELVTTGKTTYPLHGFKWYKAPLPKARDVFMCLVSDASYGDMPFAEFCVDFGYSVVQDGRTYIQDNARSIYDSCVDTRFKLRGALGDIAFSAAVDLASEW